MRVGGQLLDAAAAQVDAEALDVLQMLSHVVGTVQVRQHDPSVSYNFTSYKFHYLMELIPYFCGEEAGDSGVAVAPGATRDECLADGEAGRAAR